MGLSVIFTKTLAAADDDGIAASQSPAASALLLNGAASTYLSTTTTAATAVGGVVLSLTSVAGLTAGQLVADSTSGAIVSGTVITGVGTSTVTLNKPVGGAGVGNGDTIVFSGVATIDTYNSSTNTVPGRRVIITSGGNDSGITFAIVGTNSTGNRITDTVTGANIGIAVSNLDFVTVTSITPSAAAAGTVKAGTNGVGSSPWAIWNWRGYAPMNVSEAVEIVSGAANYTVQHSFDDPNFLSTGVSYPLAFNDVILNQQDATGEGAVTTPIKATRILLNSGTGTVRGRFVQAGAG